MAIKDPTFPVLLQGFLYSLDDCLAGMQQTERVLVEPAAEHTQTAGDGFDQFGCVSAHLRLRFSTP